MTELFRNTLSFWQWGLLALVPPAIIALYFLKLRRQPLEVPSTYLWRRSIDDLHVNSLWQRLRQNLLMFLQLLLVGLAILALLRPGWEGTKLAGQRFMFVVDNSASMSASDVAGVPDRLTEAKRLAANLIDQMDSDMTAMIISFADTPQVVQAFTSNRRLLRERLDAIQPTARSTDLRGALELAGSLANPGRVAAETSVEETDIVEPPPATTYIFSDGRFEDVAGIPLDNLKPVYVPVGSFEAPNLAITAVAARRSEDRTDEQQAFVQVANFTPEPQVAIVELELDGRFIDAAEVEIPAGETAGAVFPLPDGSVGTLVARLKYEIDGIRTDTLRQDDVGYEALNNAATGKVLVVSPGNVSLDMALGTERAARLATITFVPPASLDSAEYRRASETGEFDLIIYDQCAPEQMPRANTLFIGRLPPEPAWRGSEVASEAPGGIQPTEDQVVVRPQVIDWDRASPLLDHVELGDVEIATSLVVQPPAGGVVLIESTVGPIAAISSRESYQDVVLGFEIVGQAADGSPTVNTNWPLRHAFPTFWLNVLEYLAANREVQAATAVRPGQLVELHAPANADELTVIDPGGRSVTIARSVQGTFPYANTETPGVYQVRLGNQVIQRFAVNLFDRAESDVRVRPSQDAESRTVQPADIRIGEVDVAATTDRGPGRREMWKVLVMCALFVLMLEWYIYNRRVYL